MSADLRELLERTAPSPSTPIDPTRIASRSRRRTRRQRGTAGLTGVALVALLAVIAWPGVVPGDRLIIEDRAADQPEVPVLDLPEGWSQVQVGDAVFGIPAELEIVEVDADDPLPCDDSGNRAYLATESYPAATHDAAGNDYACNAAGSTAPQLFAAPLSAVPAAHLGDDSEWEPRPIGGLDGQWRLSPGDVATPSEQATETDDGAGVTDGELESRIASYRVPAVDLHLRFVTTVEDHIDLEEAILATITPVGTAGTEGTPDEPAEEQVDEPTEAAPEPGEPTRVEVDLPDGWVQVTVGDATFGVPTDSATGEFELDILELAPTDGPPCHNGLDRIGTYLAPDGYPTGVVQDSDPGTALEDPYAAGFCRLLRAGYTSILAAPLRTVPGSVREARDRAAAGDPPPATAEEALLGGLRGEVTFVDDHLVTYAIPQVDLWLEFHAPDPWLVEQVLLTVTSVRPLEGVGEPGDLEPDGDEGTMYVIPRADVEWFETPGNSLLPRGRVIRDPSELDAAWDAAGSDGSFLDEGLPPPPLRDDEVALLTTFSYRSDGPCRGSVDLSHVEIHGQLATVVFEPSDFLACTNPQGDWTVAAVVPADTLGLSDVTTVEAVERP